MRGVRTARVEFERENRPLWCGYTINKKCILHVSKKQKINDNNRRTNAGGNSTGKNGQIIKIRVKIQLNGTRYFDLSLLGGETE